MSKFVDAIKSRLQHSNTNNSSPVPEFYGNSPGEPQFLSAAISASRNVRRNVDSLATAQHSAVQQLLKWASREPNAAIRDVVHQISELDFMWLDSQSDFKDDIEDFERTLSRIVDLEEESLLVVSKTKKEKLKAHRLLANVQNQQISSYKQTIEWVNSDLQESLRENEVQKLLYLKKTLSNLAKAYVRLGAHCSVIFDAQQRISSLLPDSEASVSQCPKLSDVKYNGADISRKIVAATRAKLANSKGKKCNCCCGSRRNRSKSRVKRRCSEPIIVRPESSSSSEYEDYEEEDTPATHVQVQAPPPYNPSAPILRDRSVEEMASKLEEVISLSSRGKHQSLYPPIPPQSSSMYAFQTPPPPYYNKKR